MDGLLRERQKPAILLRRATLEDALVDPVARVREELGLLGRGHLADRLQHVVGCVDVRHRRGRVAHLVREVGRGGVVDQDLEAVGLDSVLGMI